MTDKGNIQADPRPAPNPAAIIGFVLVAAGALALLANLMDVSFGRFLWPLWVISPGLLLLIPALRMQAGQPEPLAFLAIPGAAVLSVGGLLFLTNAFNYWQGWAYLWAPIPLSVLWGVSFAQRYQADEPTRRSLSEARRVMIWITLAFAAFFELLIYHQPLGHWWPVLVILLGVILVARNLRAG